MHSQIKVNLEMKNQKPSRRGAAVVELAISLPVIFLIMLGTAETCNRIFLKQSLEIMAFEGVRVSITPGATNSDIQGQVNAIAATRNVSVDSITITPANFADLPIGEFVEVKVVGASKASAGFLGAGQSSAVVSMMKNHVGD